MSSNVYALAVSGTDLYAGGAFTNAGGVAANYIAKWNGSVWSPLGTGMNNQVRALAANGTNLYAGGFFTSAGGGTANRIALWDGSAWSTLGSGMNDNVYALAVMGGYVYAGGHFTNAGGTSANYIARWNGSTWLAMGSGVSSDVRTLAADNSGHLFLGGFFSSAGTLISPYVVQANIIPVGGWIENIRAGSGSVTLDIVGFPGSTYLVKRANDVNFTTGLTTLLTTNAPADGVFNCVDSNPPGVAAFYRLANQ
jgi:hypothetical protein